MRHLARNIPARVDREDDIVYRKYQLIRRRLRRRSWETVHLVERNLLFIFELRTYLQQRRLRCSPAETNELPIFELLKDWVALDSSGVWSFAPEVSTLCDFFLRNEGTVTLY